MKFELFLSLLMLTIAFSKKCLNANTNLKLICYYSDVNDIDFCGCTHVILPSSSDVSTINYVRNKFTQGSILLTVNDFNENTINILNEGAVDGVDINLRKIASKNDVTDFIATVRSKFGPNLSITVTLPARTQDLVKFYDLKVLSKRADLFILQTAFLWSAQNVTFHPSQLSGQWDMQNTDSVVDLVHGLGSPLSKLVITSPVQAFEFTLQNESLTASGSPAIFLKSLTRKQLCVTMREDGKWTLERDEDQAGPYIFRNNRWIAFEDSVSVDIKSKYARVRGLAGLALKDLYQDDNKACDKSLLEAAHSGLSKQLRAPRGAVLQSLKREILDTASRIVDNVQLSPYRISRIVDTEGNIHTVRQDTRTEFECSRQGYYVHPRSCGRFYRCVKFDQLSDEFDVFEFDCPDGLSFDTKNEVCVWPGSLPYSTACSGSSEIAPVPKSRYVCKNEEGYYADPENCRWFFACIDHGKSPLSAYEFRCPFGLVFDQEKLNCEWSWLVPTCSNEAIGNINSGLLIESDRHQIQNYQGLGVLDTVVLGNRYSNENQFYDKFGKNVLSSNSDKIPGYTISKLIKNNVEHDNHGGYFQNYNNVLSYVKTFATPSGTANIIGGISAVHNYNPTEFTKIPINQLQPIITIASAPVPVFDLKANNNQESDIVANIPELQYKFLNPKDAYLNLQRTLDISRTNNNFIPVGLSSIIYNNNQTAQENIKSDEYVFDNEQENKNIVPNLNLVSNTPVNPNQETNVYSSQNSNGRILIDNYNGGFTSPADTHNFGSKQSNIGPNVVSSYYFRHGSLNSQSASKNLPNYIPINNDRSNFQTQLQQIENNLYTNKRVYEPIQINLENSNYKPKNINQIYVSQDNNQGLSQTEKTSRNTVMPNIFERIELFTVNTPRTIFYQNPKKNNFEIEQSYITFKPEYVQNNLYQNRQLSGVPTSVTSSVNRDVENDRSDDAVEILPVTSQSLTKGSTVKLQQDNLDLENKYQIESSTQNNKNLENLEIYSNLPSNLHGTYIQSQTIQPATVSSYFYQNTGTRNLKNVRYDSANKFENQNNLSDKSTEIQTSRLSSSVIDSNNQYLNKVINHEVTENIRSTPVREQIIENNNANKFENQDQLELLKIDKNQNDQPFQPLFNFDKNLQITPRNNISSGSLISTFGNRDAVEILPVTSQSLTKSSTVKLQQDNLDLENKYQIESSTQNDKNLEVYSNPPPNLYGTYIQSQTIQPATVSSYFYQNTGTRNLKNVRYDSANKFENQNNLNDKSIEIQASRVSSPVIHSNNQYLNKAINHEITEDIWSTPVLGQIIENNNANKFENQDQLELLKINKNQNYQQFQPLYTFDKNLQITPINDIKSGSLISTFENRDAVENLPVTSQSLTKGSTVKLQQENLDLENKYQIESSTRNNKNQEIYSNLSPNVHGTYIQSQTIQPATVSSYFYQNTGTRNLKNIRYDSANKFENQNNLNDKSTEIQASRVSSPAIDSNNQYLNKIINHEITEDIRSTPVLGKIIENNNANKFDNQDQLELLKINKNQNDQQFQPLLTFDKNLQITPRNNIRSGSLISTFGNRDFENININKINSEYIKVEQPQGYEDDESIIITENQRDIEKVTVTPTQSNNPIVLLQPTEFNGYYYDKPSIQFEDGLNINDYSNREPVQEEIFVTKKAYLTGTETRQHSTISSIDVPIYSALPQQNVYYYENQINLPTKALTENLGKNLNKTYVKVNDFNPFLPAKLTAQCTCTSNKLPLSEKLNDEFIIEVPQESPSTERVVKAKIVENYSFQPAKINETSFVTPSNISTTITETDKLLLVNRAALPENLIQNSPVTGSTITANKFSKEKPLQEASTFSKEIQSQEVVNENGFINNNLKTEIENLPKVLTCQRAGLFRHPNHCNKFYSCRWDCTKNKYTLHEFNCPVHLTFDNGMGACNWPSKGPSCAGNTLLPNELV